MFIMKSRFEIIFLLLSLCIAFITSEEEKKDDTVVQLKDGKIRGNILKSGNGNDYYSFHQIPYAAPPVGKNRFQHAQKVIPWKGILDCTNNTKICYQQQSKYGLPMSEDCLILNVNTPVKPGGNFEKLPVMVWIHGGGNSQGAGFYYGPKYIMDYGVVEVAITYRLGPLGFLTTGDGEISANLGLKDQQLALEWVNENIHLFGGDPQKVTIFGESSGSLDVGWHVLGKWNNEKKLFRAAIMQSGSPLVGFEQKDPRKGAFNCGRNLDENFSSNKTSDLLKVLQKASADSIIKACSSASGTIVENGSGFSHPPLQSLMDGNIKNISMLMGFNSEEFINAAMNPDKNILISLDSNPEKIVPDAISMSTENKIIAGKLLKKIYTKASFEEDISGYCVWNSDHQMNIHVCKQAELMSSRVPVYLYQFSYYGQLGQRTASFIPGAGRVAHGADLNYIFEYTNNSDLSKFPKEDIITQHRFLKMWTNFAKYLNPTPEKDPLLNNIIWPTTNSKNLLYLNFNETLELKENPRKYKGIEAVLDSYIEKPFIYY